MKSLHPTVWRTCRVLSNENRLMLLWKLFQVGEANVGLLGNEVGLKEPVASSYLRALHARGLILSERRKNYVFYSPEANPEVAHASQMLDAMKACYEQFFPIKMVMYHMTAFTHARRIDIVRVLNQGALDEAQLSIRAGISPQALYRHIRKLVARGYVAKVEGKLVLAEQTEALPKALLSIVLGHD